jgi:hypothetical protein
MEFFTTIWNWLLARWAERTSWDGGVIIALGVVALMFSQLMPYAAWAAIAYGAWTLLKDESGE